VDFWQNVEESCTFQKIYGVWKVNLQTKWPGRLEKCNFSRKPLRTELVVLPLYTEPLQIIITLTESMQQRNIGQYHVSINMSCIKTLIQEKIQLNATEVGLEIIFIYHIFCCNTFVFAMRVLMHDILILNVQERRCYFYGRVYKILNIPWYFDRT
jgi:hypothetical protein